MVKRINQKRDEYNSFSNDDNNSLHQVVKGAGFVFIGTIIGMFLGFIIRIIIARSFSQSDYGVYSLGFAMFSIFSLISTMGLKEGVTRQIAFNRGKQKNIKVKDVILSSIVIVFLLGCFFSIILYVFSDYIAIYFFDDLVVSPVLKIISFSIPFSSILAIFISIFRGFELAKPNVYFHHIGRNVVFLILLLVVIFFNFDFKWAIWSFVISIILSAVIIMLYASFKSVISIGRIKKRTLSISCKQLIVFSLPLLITAILNMVMGWTDTLMLGYYKTSDVVGLYNAALPLAHLLPIGLTSMVFIYTPIASKMYSENRLDDLKKNYVILTKWIFSITLPVLLIFLLFPNIVLGFLYGPSYITGAMALQILSIGFFTHTFLGPNGSTLTSLGKTRILMYASLSSAVINVILNVSLIPITGIAGAALATGFSLALANIILSMKLYFSYKIHPFTKNYLKPIFLSIFLIVIIFFIAKTFFVVTILYLIPLFLLFVIVYLSSLVLTKSFEKEDINLLLSIEKKTGLNLTYVKKIIIKFL